VKAGKKEILVAAISAIIMLILFNYINFRILRVDNKYYNSFSSQLMAAVQRGGSFDMKDIAPFEWDQMHVIGPYTSKTEMHKIVGTKWTTADTYVGYLILDKTWFGEHPLDDDRFHKLIFVKGNKVMLDITLDRNDVDFVQVNSPVINDGIKFEIEKKDRRNVVKHIIPQ
jgi:hypothetical protein